MSGGAKLNAAAGGSVTMVVDDTLTTDQVVEIETKGSIGYGQTWQDMTASRALSTTYTNDTGRPISISVMVQHYNGSTGWAGCIAYIDGTSVQEQSVGKNGEYAAFSISLIVPAGSTYKIEKRSASPTGVRWMELREVA